MSTKVEERTAKGKPTPPPPGGNSFKACRVDQQNLLVSARNQAKVYPSESENDLNAHASGTQRYLEWFGVLTTKRHTAITNADSHECFAENTANSISMTHPEE